MYNQDLKDKVKSLFDRNKNLSSRKIITNNSIIREIIDQTNFLSADLTFPERCYWIVNDLYDYPKKCLTCDKRITKFRSMTDGYHVNYCSKSCQKTGTNKLKRDKQQFKYQIKKQKLTKEQINEKRQNTLMSRYGVKSFSSELFGGKRIRNRIQNILKRKIKILENSVMPAFNIEEYTSSKKDYLWKCKKCESEFLDSLANGTLPRCPVCFTKNASNPQHEIKQFLIDNNLKPRLNDRSILKKKEIDIFLREHNLGIEFHGLYWHSEKANVFDKHHMIKKITSLSNHKIKLIQIMEDEWRFKQDIVKSRLLSACGLTKKEYARKLTFVDNVSTNDAQQFLFQNHIQGSCISSVRFGLVNENGELLCLMTFGKSRYNKNYEWELLRYCTKLNHTIIGGPSKLLKEFIKRYNPKNIISYADRRWSDGNMYKMLGFKLLSITKPNYSYISNKGKRINRIHFQKHKLHKILKTFNPNLSEVENCKNNGYYRIWDAGSLKFLYSST